MIAPAIVSISRLVLKCVLSTEKPGLLLYEGRSGLLYWNNCNWLVITEVYISQLVRYARICTSKVDFINRLRGLSLRLRQQGFETNLLQKSFNKFVNRLGLIVEKYGTALREMRLAIQVSQRFGHPRVLGIPIPISLAFWASQNADHFDFA